MNINRIRLYFQRKLYDHQNTNEQFLRAVKQNVRYHQRHCKEYAAILEHLNFDCNNLSDINDLYQLPVIPTMYLKQNHLASMHDWRLPIKATSSGTSGNKSRIGYNFKLLIYAAIMAWRMTSHHKILSLKRTNYIMLGYEPHETNQTLIVKTQGVSALFAPPKKKAYALKYRENGYEVDYEGLKSALDLYAAETSPVRLIGFPSYMLFLLKELKNAGKYYRLPKGSMIFLGGGWKGFYKEKVEKEVLFQLVEEVLGIPKHNCREFFGVAEHPVLYCSCPNHHFHIPKYSRVIIRDVVTLEPVENGTTGLVNLLTPAADSMPLTSVMTDDLGILHDGATCGCGIDTPYLEIIGRVGMKEIQTCALQASDLLKGDV